MRTKDMNQNVTTQKDACPLNGKCLDNQLIYSCHVKTIESDVGEFYIGLTENTFKERWN